MLEKSDIRITKILVDFDQKSMEVEVAYDIIEDGKIISTIKDSGYARRRFDPSMFDEDLKLMFPIIKPIDTKDIDSKSFMLDNARTVVYPTMKENAKAIEVENNMESLVASFERANQERLAAKGEIDLDPIKPEGF